jgi:hypothetical protein
MIPCAGEKRKAAMKKQPATLIMQPAIEASSRWAV